VSGAGTSRSNSARSSRSRALAAGTRCLLLDIDIMQIDACRVAGVNENIANLLLAAKFGVPVCPHAGGAGLREIVQHLAFFDYVAVSGSMAGRRIEWIDHLHEHYVDPARIPRGRYIVPRGPGASTQMRAESLAEFSFPAGGAWR
jgi:L-fuconate dehydratase